MCPCTWIVCVPSGRFEAGQREVRRRPLCTADERSAPSITTWTSDSADGSVASVMEGEALFTTAPGAGSVLPNSVCVS